MKVYEEIKNLLLEEHSKAQVYKIIDWVGSDSSRMDALMKCFFSRELRVCQRASWPLFFIYEKQPEMITPYLEKMVHNLEDPLHDAVVRNTMRIFQEVNIPESIEGELLERCFQYINNPKKAGAIRAFSMRVATKIVRKYPELIEELILSIEDQLEHGTTGFKSAGKKELVILKKLMP